MHFIMTNTYIRQVGPCWLARVPLASGLRSNITTKSAESHCFCSCELCKVNFQYKVIGFWVMGSPYLPYLVLYNAWSYVLATGLQIFFKFIFAAFSCHQDDDALLLKGWIGRGWARPILVSDVTGVRWLFLELGNGSETKSERKMGGVSIYHCLRIPDYVYIVV